jgi:class 3 adenylate cyclase/putative methionine-R-sulfoxide reductase with GAF domain
MKRRSGAGSERVKARGRKTTALKRLSTPKATRNRGASIAGQETVVARLTYERDEALLRETANAEILGLISKSPDNLEIVFRSILENATRICNAKFGTVHLVEGDCLRRTAHHYNTPPAYLELIDGLMRRPGPRTALGRVVATKQSVHIADLAAEQLYAERDPLRVAGVEVLGIRTLVVVPMLKGSELIGAIAIYRQEVRPFTDKQIEFVQNFAAQAVIAIENARLLSELRQRTTDLGEALEQQTATADVLRVISSSPGDLQPVFEAMLQNAVRVCDAKFGALFRFDGSAFHLAALINTPPELAEFLKQRGPFLPLPGSNLERAMQTHQVCHAADVVAEAIPSIAGRLGGARSVVCVPMLKDRVLVGAFTIYRQEVRPFTDKQIALLENFAAQAVIAIENARLLNELRQRTTDLGEALERQTATSEVLRVISGSPSDLQPIFEAMLENATRICGTKAGVLFRYADGAYTAVANIGVPLEFAEYLERGPIRPGPGTGLRRIMETKETVHIVDPRTEQAYADRDPWRVATAELGRVRSLLNVPMLRKGELIGALGVFREEVRPFTEKQIELVTNFAAQAVIAIENARLLDDLNRLNQQLEQRVADQVGEIERMGRLRRFLPPQVADLIVASGTEKQLESHRREITALFCDLRGFTGFSESADPEDVMALLRDYHAAIGEIVIKYGGTLERFAGDGVMVIFNDPVPIENPALQAVLMALDMRNAIGEMIEKWRDLGHDLGFGIGIAHGFATLGTIGFEGRFDYAAIGTVSNVASRLCDEAKPGQILVSPRVRQAVDKAVTVEPVGEFELKGIRRPMAAYNVLASSSSKPN